MLNEIIEKNKGMFCFLAIIFIFYSLSKPTESQQQIPSDNTSNITITSNEFIDKISSSAQNQNKIFPSIVISQAILESNYGRSSLASKYNNLFGIKNSKNWRGKTIKLSTKEEYNNQTVIIKDNFRYYSSWQESIIDHTKFLQQKRYINAGILNCKSPEEQIIAIKKAGYATDSKYVSKILQIINFYNLKKYDII